MSSNSTEKREIRKFGLVALVFFGSLCGLGFWKGKILPVSLFGFLALLGTCFLLFPGPSRPVYSGWLKIARFIGQVVTVLSLSIAYYLVITPAAWLKRVFGGRPLPGKPDRGASSYWVVRNEPVQPKERFFKRY